MGASRCLLTSRVLSALTRDEDVSCLGSFSTLPSALHHAVPAWLWADPGALGMLSASGYVLKVGLLCKVFRLRTCVLSSMSVCGDPCTEDCTFSFVMTENNVIIGSQSLVTAGSLQARADVYDFTLSVATLDRGNVWTG